jgi:hypothetical protein
MEIMFNAAPEANHGDVSQSSGHERARAHKRVFMDTLDDSQNIFVIAHAPPLTLRSVPACVAHRRSVRSLVIRGLLPQPHLALKCLASSCQAGGRRSSP